ncbi:MAG: hypothetical protein LBJ62_06810 [Bifidobacteriaceae bacterium]|nr:hypothetical protein [Bifidobacteriaceae bacterium]
MTSHAPKYTATPDCCLARTSHSELTSLNAPQAVGLAALAPAAQQTSKARQRSAETG